MAIKYGRSKHMDDVTLKDILKYHIWDMTPDDSKYMEEGVRPVSNKTNVDREIAEYIPEIALRVEGTEMYALGNYWHEEGELSTLFLWIKGKWVELENAKGLKFPLRLVALPKIMGKADVKFVLKNAKGSVKRVAK